MMYIRGKHGAMMGLAIFFVLVAALALIGRIEHTSTIGQKQADILVAYTNLEAYRLYVENAVRYSAYDILKNKIASSGCFSGLDKSEFEGELGEKMRSYTGVDLSVPAYKVELPSVYDFATTIVGDKITISGVGTRDIKISSATEETIRKLSRTRKAGQEYESLPNSEYNLLKLKAPKYLVSGGANINIDITCDELSKFADALTHVPSAEVSD